MDLLNEFPLYEEDADEFENTLASPEYHPGNAEGPPPAVKLARVAIECNNLEDLARHLEDSVDWLHQESAGLIHLAVKMKAHSCLQHLLGKHGPVDVVGRNAKNQTPLYAAVKSGWLEGVKLLLDANADIEIICGNQVTEANREQTRSETNRRDVENSEKTVTGQKTVLQLAVCLHSAEILLAILVAARKSNNYKEIVNARHPASKMTPLVIAVTRGKLRFVELLMNNGADVTALDRDGQSALHWAVMKNSLPVVKALYEAEREKVKALATLPCGGKFKGTPLSLAVYLGNLEIVKYLENTVKASLLDRSSVTGTGVGISGDKINCNVLHLAALKSTQNVTDYFTKRLAEVAVLKGLVNEKTLDGCTPLSFALRKHHIDYAHALLAWGADLSAQRGDGKTDMDVVINHLPSAPKFMTDVLDRSIKKHEKHSHVAVNYTVFMPTCYCSNAEIGSDSMSNGAVTAAGFGDVPHKSHAAGVDKKGRLKTTNRRNGGDRNVAASSSRDDHELQPLSPTVPPQAEAAGTDREEEHVAVDIEPKRSAVAAGSRDVAHNHFGVLKELLKLGKSLNHMKILEHPLVESYLYLRWIKISGLFALLLVINVVFALLLSVSAILAWVAIDDDDSLDENHNTTSNYPPNDFSNETTDSGLNSADHLHLCVILLNIFNVAIFLTMVPLVIYEIKCLWYCKRPWIYWIETALKFISFLSTTCWLATGSSLAVFIAIISAWIQVTVLVLEMRQCHGCGRLIIHFIKEVLKYKGLVFGLVTVVASVYISSGGFPAIIKIDTGDHDVIWYSTTISLMILLCNITFFFFLLLLGYALKTFSDNYPRKEKVDLMVHQIEFLEVYENYLLGNKPFDFSCLQRLVQLWAPIAYVKREYLVYRDDDEVPSDEVTPDTIPRKTSLVFPEELHRDIIVKGLENREHIMVQLKAAADAEKKKSVEVKVQKRVADDSQRIKNLEGIMKQVAIDSARINHLEAMIEMMMEHTTDNCNQIRNLEKMMEKMLQQLSRTSETESEL